MKALEQAFEFCKDKDLALTPEAILEIAKFLREGI